MKRMLFNATQAEELRVAIVDGQKLIDLDIESAAKEQRKSNIYKGVITRIEPSLEAAFVNYGTERHGFLPFKEVARAYYRNADAGRSPRIQDVLREGQEVIVQVDKDERGNKGAALTTYISLAGRYLVLMPNNPRGGGVSRRVEGEERAELRDTLDQIEVPQGMSLIARTAGIGRSAEELQWDLNYLLQLWRAIEGAANEQSGAFLIYQEGSLVIRAIRDYFQPDIGEILIDTDDVYEQARQFMAHVMPANVACVKRYRDDVPLFSRFQIEHQIETAFARQVNLPSGGAIVIDHTEALVAIDINSGRATKGADIEETAFRTNLEAADEIARQLRLRDLGGLIVIDFIDMESQKNQREVENRLRDDLKFDRARVQMGKISRFGLMELSRQRLRPALAETSYIPCPRCTGTGHIRSTESAALHILRILEEEAMKENTGAVHAQVPVDVATFLLNEKRTEVHAIELRHHVTVLLIPNIHFETPQHTIVRLRHDELNQEGVAQPSYKLVETPEEGVTLAAQQEARPARPEAAVKAITPPQPAPVVEPKAEKMPEQKPGIITRIFSWFSGNRQAEEKAPEQKPRRPEREGRGRRSEGERGERSERGERRRRGEDARAEKGEQRTEQRQAARGTDETKEPREPKERRGRQDQQQRGRDRQEREPREPREPRQQAPRASAEDAAVTGAMPAALAPETPASPAGEEREGRGRRGRRGRGRREGREEREAVTAGEIAVPADATAIAAAGTAPEAPAPEATSAPALQVASAPATAVAVTAEPAAETALEPVAAVAVPEETAPAAVIPETPRIEVAEPSPLPVPAPTEPEPVEPAEARAEAPAAAVEIKMAAAAPAVADVGKALEESGLVLIETRPGSIPAAPVQEEAPQPKPRRSRPAPVQSSEEPLVMVETKRD